jgi:hypothetical protein
MLRKFAVFLSEFAHLIFWAVFALTPPKPHGYPVLSRLAALHPSAISITPPQSLIIVLDEEE